MSNHLHGRHVIEVLEKLLQSFDYVATELCLHNNGSFALLERKSSVLKFLKHFSSRERSKVFTLFLRGQSETSRAMFENFSPFFNRSKTAFASCPVFTRM
jgi:hypothetical protein